MIIPESNILNQLGTPMFNSNTFANRPAFGIAGRIFISTDTKEFYRDTGTAWELIGGPGSGTITGSGSATQVAFFNGTNSIAGNNDLWWDNTSSRLGIGNNAPATNLDIHGNNATIQIDGRSSSSAFVQFVKQGSLKWRIGNINTTDYFQIFDNTNSIERIKLENTGLFTLTGNFNNITSRTAVANDGWYGIFSNLSVNIPASTTFTGGNSFGSITGANRMNFIGSSTFPVNAVAAGFLSSNIFSFSNAGNNVTITQSTGIRAIAAITAFNQVNTLNSSTLSHLAAFHAIAPFSASGTIDVTNYFGLLINASDERTALNITNRWAIYQQGINDRNYFNGNILVKTTTDNGNALQVNGAASLTGALNGTSATFTGAFNAGVFNANTPALFTTNNVANSPALTAFKNTNAGNEDVFRVQSFFGDAGVVTVARINSSGAATFSSSVTATSATISSSTPIIILNRVAAGNYGKISFRDQNSEFSYIQASSATGVIRYDVGPSSGWGGIHEWYNDQTKTMTLNQFGNLGIGVAPSAWNVTTKALQINNGSIYAGSNYNFIGSNIVWQNDGDKYISNGFASIYGQNSSGQHVWFTAPSGTAGNTIAFTQAMTLDASGRLGIGTTSPGNLLHIYGTDGSSYMRFTSDVATTGTRIGYNGTEFRIDQQQNADVTIRTNGAERMRITSGGNVLIGTSTNGGSRLRVVGLPTSSAGLSAGDIWNDGGTLKIV